MLATMSLATLSFLLPILQAAEPPALCAEVAPLLTKIEAARLERTVRELVAFGTRHSLSVTDDPKRGIGAARDYVERRLRVAAERSQGRMTVTRESHVAGARGGGELTVVNLVATLRGSVEPDRVYVVSGHYDSRNSDGRDAKGDAPGANDDGSGTAAVLEVADVLAGVPLRATLRLVSYDGEELGLLGSTADAKALAAAKAQVDGMMTLDICGNTESADGRRERGYVRVFSYQDGASDSSGRNLARSLADCARRYLAPLRVKMILRGDRYGRGGDHRPFSAAGFAAVRLSEPFENFGRQHMNVAPRDGKPYGDLPEFMDFDYLAQLARLVLAQAYELANAPPVPPPPRVLGTPELGTRVVLRRPPDLDWLAGYEIVWRDSATADWEHARFVAREAVTDEGLVLPGVLLDDSVLGVRAVAKDGARSRAVSAPEPAARR
jgi:hypothetical protein